MEIDSLSSTSFPRVRALGQAAFDLDNLSTFVKLLSAIHETLASKNSGLPGCALPAVLHSPTSLGFIIDIELSE